MFAVNTYEQIIAKEKEIGTKQIVVLLFVRPSAKGAGDIIEEFDYIHYSSDKYCSIYAVGYSNDFNLEKEGYKKSTNVAGNQWYFSNKEFVSFKNDLEKRIQWEYSGEIELLILQSDPESKKVLNFQNYVAIDINHGLREGYLDSFERFMESLIRASKQEITAKGALKKINNKRLSPTKVIAETVMESKKVPKPIKKIVNDRLFYKSCVRKR